MNRDSTAAGKGWSRRTFLRSLGVGGAAAAGAAPRPARASRDSRTSAEGTAKNVLMFVSDGMNIGTLGLTDLFCREFIGKPDPWMKLYRDPTRPLARALMDSASASSPVTDSAAVSSAWSSGVRVPNRSINFDADGNRLTPLYETVSQAGKATALVTTAAVTHATPAGFASTVRHRNSEFHIAPQYRELGVDLILGGGRRFFDSSSRPDKADLLARHASDGYQVVANRTDLLAAGASDRLIGLFAEGHLPYHLDWLHSGKLQREVPTLAEMTRTAIRTLEPRREGFVMQVEAARVDHAGHHNDLGAIIHDQIAFGEALTVGLQFAAERDDTLVIIATDHGCGGPNLNGRGPSYNESGSLFANTRSVRRSLDSISRQLSTHEGDYDISSANMISTSLGMNLTSAQSTDLLAELNAVPASKRRDINSLIDLLATFHSPTCGVSWNGHTHTAEPVEIAAIGPGCEALPPFIDTTFIRPWILSACGIERAAPHRP